MSEIEPQMESFSGGGLPTDDDLVRRAQDDAQAFAAVYQRYAKRVYRYAYSRVGEAAAAEDVTSQVFHDALVALIKMAMVRLIRKMKALWESHDG